jgi:hypothetical protein
MRGYYYSKIFNFCQVYRDEHLLTVSYNPAHVDPIANTIMFHFKIELIDEPLERLQEIIIGILQNLI